MTQMQDIQNMKNDKVAVEAMQLTKNYGKGSGLVSALRGVNVQFRHGEFTAIMGPSGSGKSTLMHILAGLDRATSGKVIFNNKNITSFSDNELTLLRRKEIGFIFQSFNLLPMFTAKQNILLPLQMSGLKIDQKWYDNIVSTLGLSDRINHRPSELSGGQQQRVAIARALVTKPSVIFADEPTGNLDLKSGAQVLRFLRNIVDDIHQTVIMVTHDAVAASHADRVIVLADGQITADMSNPTVEQISMLLNREQLVQVNDK